MAFQLQTTAFLPNGRIPDIYTCEGEDVPPPLAWSNPPPGTRSLALIVDDPDAPGGTFCHWAVFDIQPTGTPSPRPVAVGAHQGVNDFGRMGYGGPCPPPGRPHRYRFRLLALDVPRLDIRPQAGCRDLERAAERHKLAEALLVGTYGR